MAQTAAADSELNIMLAAHLSTLFSPSSLEPLKVTPEMTHIQNELKRVDTEKGLIQRQLSALDNEEQKLLGELDAIEQAQRNTALAAKLKTLQDQHEILPLVHHICAIISDCLGRGGYSAVQKGPKINIINRRDNVVFRIDGRGNVLTSTGKAKKFNVFNVAYDDLRLKVKQLVWQ